MKIDMAVKKKMNPAPAGLTQRCRWMGASGYGRELSPRMKGRGGLIPGLKSACLNGV